MTVPAAQAALKHKAERTRRSARLLADAGDAEGACNRAYYAMFDAARVALLIDDGTLSVSDLGKSHQGLMRRFSAQLVKTGKLPSETGRDLRLAEEARIAADYRADSVDASDAFAAVERAERFIDTIWNTFLRTD